MARGSSWGDIDNDGLAMSKCIWQSGDVDYISRSENVPKRIIAYMNMNTSRTCATSGKADCSRDKTGWVQVSVAAVSAETISLADIDGDGGTT